MKKRSVILIGILLEFFVFACLSFFNLQEDVSGVQLSSFSLVLALLLTIVVVVVVYRKMHTRGAVILYYFLYFCGVFFFSLYYSQYLKMKNKTGLGIRSFCADVSIIVPTLLVLLLVLKPWKRIRGDDFAKLKYKIKRLFSQISHNGNENQSNCENMYDRHSHIRSFSPMDLVDRMEGHEFEYYCADLLENNGFSNVHVTSGSGDQGIDILAVKDGIKYGIQCKCYSSDLGNKPVQEAYAGIRIYKCHVAVVLTNRYFTPGAIEVANATGVLLWDRDKLQELIENT